MVTARRGSVLTSQDADFPRWYQEVLDKAELADNGPVRGTMVIRPYGYALWERVQAEIDTRIKLAGAENVYLPLFIPESYLQREAEHVEGFSPELAVVTHAGGKALPEPLVVRPTSETVFGGCMSKWVQSHRDLPMLLNQWANVVRWELRPRLFLRTTEFLWQEGHTAAGDAAAYARRIHLEVYRDFLQNVLELTAAGVRARVDLRTDQGFGRRVTDWELKGVPLRIEIGPRDLANGEVSVIRRDTRAKTPVPVGQVAATVVRLLDTVQQDLHENAVRRLTSRMVDTESLQEAREVARSGFARIPWRILGVDGERALVEETISVRCLQTADGAIPPDPDAVDVVAVVGRSY